MGVHSRSAWRRESRLAWVLGWPAAGALVARVALGSLARVGHGVGRGVGHGVALGVALGVGLGACAGDEAGAEQGAGGPTALAERVPEPDGAAALPTERDATVTIALRRLPSSLDPAAELDPWGQRIVDDLVFEGLTVRAGAEAPFADAALADTCRIQPSVAPTHVYCHLRPGVAFHDGKPVTLEDVLASVEHFLDPRRSALRQRHGLAGLRKVEIVAAPPDTAAVGVGSPGLEIAADGSRWIHIEFAQAEPLALERIAAMKVAPKAARRGAGFGRAPVGTGPMRVRSFDGERIELERSEHARRDSGAKAIVFELERDGAAALVRMRRGDLHVLAEVAPAHVPGELAKPGMAPRFTAWRLTPPRWDLLFFNLRRGPQARLEVRRALARALPRMALADALDPMPAARPNAPVDLEAPDEIDLAALAEAKAAADWGMAGLPARNVPADDEDGLAAARAELEALGWRMDRGRLRRRDDALRIVLMWDHDPGASTTTANALRKAWRALGVQVPQVTASFAYLLGLMHKGEFDVALGRLATRSDADLHAYFHSKGALNIPGIADPELDQALAEYRSAATRSDRRDAQRRIAERLAALVPVAVLHAPTEIMLVSRRVAVLEFVDDLPRLDTLALTPASAWSKRR